MKGDQDSASEQIRAAASRCIQADRDGATLRTVEWYLGLFPGYEELVREVYERVFEKRGKVDPLVDDEGESGDVEAATPEPGSPTRPEDREFTGFEKVRTLGSGAQGVVFLAREKALGRLVALKVLSNLTLFEERQWQRFLREAELASQLQHPGICTVYSFGLDEDIPYIAMQYVDGPTLAEVIDDWRTGAVHEVPSALSTPPTRKEGVMPVVAMLETTARAVHAAHKGRVLHRDLKPSNVMLDGEGRPVVMDFGLARSTEQDSSLTLSGITVGTPAYLPPEQLLAGFVRADERCDVYSLGVTMYEALTLEHPFPAATREQLYRAIRQGNARDPRQVNRALSKDLSVVLATAMDKDPERRYGSAEDLAEDLRRVREHRPIAARPAGPVLRLRRWFERSPALASSLLLLILCLTVWVVTSTLLLDEAVAQRQRADARTAEYEQLATARELQELVQAADPTLWQLTAEGQVRLQAWLQKAQALVARVPVLEASLAAMRENGRRVESMEGRRSLGGFAAMFEQLDDLRDRQRRLRSELEAHADTGLQAVRDRVEKEIATLERDIASQPAWTFADPKDAWRYEKVSELVAALERLGVDRPGEVCIPVFERRLRLAGRVQQETVAGQRNAWQRVREHLRGDPRFRGVATGPVAGLVPLGPDPQSRLQEFALFGTGTVPVRNTSDGRLGLTDTSAVVLVLVPGAATTIGPHPKDKLKFPNETQRRVVLAPFLVGKFEITQAQWSTVMARNPSTFKAGTTTTVGEERREISFTGRHPVETCTWTSAQEFASRVGAALPTEAQWEYACRASSTKRFVYGNDRESLRDHENVRGQEFQSVQAGTQAVIANWSDDFPLHGPVGAMAGRNGFGLADVLGNVAEWCRDCYVARPTAPSSSPGDGLILEGTGDQRPYRGGCWYFQPEICRAASRNFYDKEHSGSHLGIRIVRTWE